MSSLKEQQECEESWRRAYEEIDAEMPLYEKIFSII